MRVLTICDGVVTVEDRSEIRRVRADDFWAKMREQAPVSTPLLPAGTVRYIRKDKFSSLAYEVPPGEASVLYGAHRYRLAFPYMYLIMNMNTRSIDKTYMGFRNKPMEEDDDMLHWMPLPNQYDKGNWCWGAGLQIDPASSLRQKVDAIMNHFTNSSFNDDLKDYLAPRIPADFKVKATGAVVALTFKAWEKMTKDGMDACSIKWVPWKSMSLIMEGKA